LDLKQALTNSQQEIRQKYLDVLIKLFTQSEQKQTC